MPGQLFTQYFLTDGIQATDEWNASVAQTEAFSTFRTCVAQTYATLNQFHEPNEAVTEQELIRPVLELLGWTDYLPQQGTAHHEDVPDLLLFSDAHAKEHAAKRRKPDERYSETCVVEESKRLGLPLDTRDEDKRRASTPHGQILRYLSTAETVSDGRIRWGILTNGGVWRLYDYRARPRVSGYFEVDLAELIETDNEAGLRVFQLLFRRDSFILQEGATSTFLETALAEGHRYEKQVAEDLSGVVFERVFPHLIEALATASGQSLSEIRQAALIFLYRLLFVLYAEDRGLLPVHDSRYENYGLRGPVRDDIAGRMAEQDTFSAQATNYYDHLMTLFKLIDKGDRSIGLPPYNGGLFASEAAEVLEEVRLADAQTAPIIYALSHIMDPHEGPRFVNYRDMSVQQLGSLYERLLEREPVRGLDGQVVIRLNPYARKDSGSFFTPQELVDLIVERTLKPLVEERLKAFEDKAAALKSVRRSKAERRSELLELDPAEAVLNLKVLDPAMGSGHFLVTAVDFLSDSIAGLIEDTPAVPEWLDGEYVSPLVERVTAIRRDILRRAQESKWVIDEAQLTDQAIIRRMVLKRCIYGVDKNPLTVELAKVSLWLHSFTVGSPLSFMDHHLRCGDSLLGLRVSEAIEDLHRRAQLLLSSAIQGAETATEDMQRIEEMSDADVAEVRESVKLFRAVEETTADFRGLLDFLCGLRWLTAGMKKKELSVFEEPLATMLGRHLANAYKLLARGPEDIGSGSPDTGDAIWARFSDLWRKAKSIAEREGFLHWEVAFPGVWHNWQQSSPEGGFDAVIGNPPWDRIKSQEVEWFATRKPAIALAPTAAARSAGIQRLRSTDTNLGAEFDAAKARSESLSHMVQSYGDYPLLGGGDINLYSLFVERAMALVKPGGIVGLLVPSGIASDKTAAPFFRSLATQGRLRALYDFENRRTRYNAPHFFPDVDGRFKFCAFVAGPSPSDNPAQCAFFLQDISELSDANRCFPLAAEDFATVNPNTGTAPIFRSRRDAELTTTIYKRLPVLVDRSSGEEVKAWPVKYSTMFHMTSDSSLFRTQEELKEREGAYSIGNKRFNSPSGEWVPLYEGKMVQAFDHRAASVLVNPNNLSRPAQKQESTPDEHADPNWLPCPRFWVRKDDTGKWPEGLGWAVGFKHVTAPTNARTMIACVLPYAGFGNSLPILLPTSQTEDDIQAYKKSSYLLGANMMAFAFDFVTRQKVQGQNLNLYLIEQIPVIASTTYDRTFGNLTARELVRDHILRLTYTSHNMSVFAHDLGHDGPPFLWEDEERRHLRARLDALYFHLYRLTREEACYVLDTFPIIRQQDEEKFGRYRTRDLVLAYMNALAAGDTETTLEA